MWSVTNVHCVSHTVHSASAGCKYHVSNKRGVIECGLLLDTGTGTRLNAAPGDKFRPLHFKTTQLSQKFVKINYTKFSHTAKKYDICVVILKSRVKEEAVKYDVISSQHTLRRYLLQTMQLGNIASACISQSYLHCCIALLEDCQLMDTI